MGVEVEELTGRALDCAVAETLGWKREPAARPGGLATPPMWRRPDGIVEFEVPPYSAEIGAAWQVVERLLHLEPDLVRTDRRTWVCTLYPGGKMAEAEAATAPEAICRAALLALKEER